MKQTLGRVNTPSRHKLPSLTREAIRRFNDALVKVSFPRIKAHLADLEEAERIALEKLKNGSDSNLDDYELKDLEDACTSAFGRRQGDELHASAMWDWAKWDNEHFFIRQVFNAKTTGRLYGGLGSLQLCSKGLRRAALDWEGNNHFLYDLEACHWWALRQFCEEDQIEHGALVEFLQNGREFYAAQAGIPPKLFKKLCSSVLMLGQIPNEDWKLDNRGTKNSILKALQKHYGRRNTELIGSALKNFKEVTADVRKVIADWLDFGVQTWMYKVANRGVIKNRAGFCRSIAAIEEIGATNEKKAKRKLANFRFCGLEQVYIGHLTIMGRRNGYTPLVNLHDGLITFGEIPIKAQDDARAISEFKYAKLKHSSF